MTSLRERFYPPPTRRRNAVTHEWLTRIATLYRQGGINQICTETGKSRAQAFRLVAHARTVGILDNDDRPPRQTTPRQPASRRRRPGASGTKALPIGDGLRALRLIDCPYCNAAAGEWCRTPTGHQYGSGHDVHRIRRTHLRQLRQITRALWP